jgi:hypothetical protein
MRKILLSIFLCSLFGAVSNAQSVSITANGGTSGNIVMGTLNYHASEYIYTDAEVGSSNFLTAGTAINYVAFNVSTVGTGTTFNNVVIYMQNVPAATSTFVDGTYSLAGYTQVFSGSYTASATGFQGVTLTTPFQRTAGSNLQVLVIRTDNAAHGGYVFTSANGNNTSAAITTSRRYNSSTVAPAAGSSTLTASAFRASIQLKHTTPNDIGVQVVQTLGKIARPISSPHIISAAIINEGTSAATNVPVTLNITGANTFTNTQIVASVAPGATATVTFTAFTPTANGTNSVAVSVPSDDYAGNNNITVSQQVTPNIISTAYSTTPTQGVGFNTATGDLAVLFKNAAANTVTQITTYFNTAAQPYTVAVYDVSAGLPGTALWTSASQTAAIGANIIAVPNVAVSGNFFVVVSQTGTTNMGYAYETENPIRTGTFLFRSPTGTGAFSDFSPNNFFRVMTEVSLGSSFPVNLLSFTGENREKANNLKWTTATESNNKGFELQRSADGGNFSSIGTINSKAENGNSTSALNYSFIDEKPFIGTNYYRLKQIDRDGKATYSSVVILKGDKSGLQISAVYPSPAKDNLNIAITSTKNEKAAIVITDISGKTIRQINTTLVQGDNNLEINVSTLAKGSYYIRLIMNDEVKTSQFIKN